MLIRHPFGSRPSQHEFFVAPYCLVLLINCLEGSDLDHQSEVFLLKADDVAAEQVSFCTESGNEGLLLSEFVLQLEYCFVLLLSRLGIKLLPLFLRFQ